MGPAAAGERGAPATVVVALCSDTLGRPDLALDLGAVSAALCGQDTAARVVAVKDLCARFSDLAEVVRLGPAVRVVVGCSRARERGQRIRNVLRGAGMHPSGVRVVDLSPAPRAEPARAGEQGVARLRAAIARVSAARTAAPVEERAESLANAAVSRRDLFRLTGPPPHPVAIWSADCCDGRGPARPCTEVCPHGALAVVASRVGVDAARCTGCGACVRACRSGAMTLNGASMEELEAEANCLSQDARKLGLGIAVVCAEAEVGSYAGGSWLPLEVPSLEMVTVGWVLQVLAAGVPVAIAGCEKRACAARAVATSQFASALLGKVAPELAHLVSGPESLRRTSRREGRTLPLYPSTVPRPPSHFLQIRLSEPEATVLAVRQLTSDRPLDRQLDGAGAKSWRLESPVAPLGDVEVDIGRCSGCQCCTEACPSSALSVGGGGATARGLIFDPSACSGCAACAKGCPERAISVARAVSSAVLTGRKRVIARISGPAPARMPAAELCRLCGGPLPSSSVTGAVADRLAVSHPEVASRLRARDRCEHCLTAAGSLTGLPSSGRHGGGASTRWRASGPPVASGPCAELFG